MTLDIESVLGQVRPAEQSVPLCLGGPLVAKYEQLDVLLRDAGPAQNLGDDTSAEAIAEQMAALRQQMLAARVWFRFRALSKGDWRAAKAALPVKRDNQTDEQADDEYHLWLCRLLAATCYEPAMSADQAHRLFVALTDGQWAQLAAAAWAVNTDNQTIPFSAAASELTRRSARKSRRPGPSTSPGPSSLADANEPSASTSTTTPDA